jgi:hypothetical protein
MKNYNAKIKIKKIGSPAASTKIAALGDRQANKDDALREIKKAGWAQTKRAAMRLLPEARPCAELRVPKQGSKRVG